MIRTSRAIEEGIGEGLHLGAQVYVSVNARPVLDLAMGQISPGLPMRSDSLLLYLSSGKPLVAVVAAMLMEEGLLQLDDRVTRFIPAFAGGGKDAITVRQLLNHTAGLGKSLSSNWEIVDWDQSVAKVCAYQLPVTWRPGETAGYDPGAAWLILGEILQRITTTPFAQLMRQRLFEPLEMTQATYTLSVEQAASLKDRLSPMYNTQSGEPHRCPWSNPLRVHPPLPGASCRGTAREMARFYEALLAGEILTPATRSLLTSSSRGNLYDRTFGREMQWGLGFLIDNGPQAPYGAGVFTQPGVFGHGGQQSSLAFADPSRQLVFVAIFNGLCGEIWHHKRMLGLLEAVHQDLQISGQ